MLDYTKLLQKLQPQDRVGGDPGLELRAGVIAAINADGTADVVLSGATVPGVSRLAGAAIQVGAVVQLLSYRGSMLILGPVSASAQSSGLGIWARGQAAGDSASMATTLGQLLVTNNVTFIRNRVYEVRTHGGVRSSTAGVYGDLRPFRAGLGTQLGEFFRFPAPTANIAFNATAGGFYFTVAANVVNAAVALYGSASVASVMIHVGTATGTPRNIEVYDVGDASQFPGIAVW